MGPKQNNNMHVVTTITREQKGKSQKQLERYSIPRLEQKLYCFQYTLVQSYVIVYCVAEFEQTSIFAVRNRHQ